MQRMLLTSFSILLVLFRVIADAWHALTKQKHIFCFTIECFFFEQKPFVSTKSQADIRNMKHGKKMQSIICISSQQLSFL